MPPLGKSLPDSSQESPVCGDCSQAGLVQEFSVMFEREERGREAGRHSKHAESEKERETGERPGETDRPGLGDRIFRFWVSVVTPFL